MGINMEFGCATTWPRFVVNVVPDLFIKLSNVLIGLRRRTLEPRLADLIPTTKPWKLQLCLLRSRLIVKYINIDICEPPMLIPIPWTAL
ncbi:hypothetical protein B0H14DRAFT_3447338 [Mycena olivaceomarginata]|nr:hypothetical protein B0H14DRAFT_3447338 [Mycena olivaceomarginata]